MLENFAKVSISVSLTSGLHGIVSTSHMKINLHGSQSITGFALPISISTVILFVDFVIASGLAT